MYTISVMRARSELFDLMDPILEGEKVMITSEKGNAILLSEEEYKGIVETLYVLSDPDTLPALIEARNTQTSELETMDWRNIF